MKPKMKPLPTTFMLIGILGALVFGTFTLSGRIPLPIGFATLLIFTLMIIASLVSIMPLYPKELAKK